MDSKPTTLLIPDEIRAALEETARSTGRDVSIVANEMLAEAVKMRRIPGIVFSDTPSGRQPHLAGTGLAVWEIVRDYRDLNADWTRLRTAFHWVDEHQLRTALEYAKAYPEDIESRIASDDRWDSESVWRSHPFTRPTWR